MLKPKGQAMRLQIVSTQSRADGTAGSGSLQDMLEKNDAGEFGEPPAPETFGEPPAAGTGEEDFEPSELQLELRKELVVFRKCLMTEIRNFFTHHTQEVIRPMVAPEPPKQAIKIRPTLDKSREGTQASLEEETASAMCLPLPDSPDGSPNGRSPDPPQANHLGFGLMDQMGSLASVAKGLEASVEHAASAANAEARGLEASIAATGAGQMLSGAEQIVEKTVVGAMGEVTNITGAAEAMGLKTSYDGQSLPDPSNMSLARVSPWASTDQAENGEEDDDDGVVKLKVDGAFGSIFAKDDADVVVPHYTVDKLYYDTGFFQSVAKNERFINTTILVIAINAVYIGIDSDYNKASSLYEAHLIFIVVENLFCVFFSVELLIRFMAFRNKMHCFRDGWFRFDSFLVGLMVTETWILAPILTAISGSIKIPVEPLRLLRLLRLTRMVRLMRSFPEIVTMTKGLFIASRAVISALAMCFLLIYLFAIVMHIALENEDNLNNRLSEEMNRNFKTIPRCMWTLLLDGTFMMDGAAIAMTEMLAEGRPQTVFACMAFLLFMLVSALSVMNMLIGVLCRVVNAVAEGEMDDAAVRLVKESILIDLKNFDSDGDGMIGKDELVHVMCDKASRNVLKSLNIDRLFMLELQRMLFPSPDSKIPIKKVVELVLMCRGDLPTTVQTLASGLSYVSMMMHHMEHRLTMQLGNLAAHTSAVSASCAGMSSSLKKSTACEVYSCPRWPIPGTPAVSNLSL